MDALSVAPERLTRQQWLLGAAVAALFAGVVGASQIVPLLAFLVHLGEGFGDRSSMVWDALRSEWGIYLAYGAVAAVAGYVVWRLRDSAARVLWPVLWRAVVLYVPVSLVVTFCIAFASALIHDRPMIFFGFEVLG